MVDFMSSVSVLLPVRNGGVEFQRQLDALASQTFGGELQVVIVNNNSTDDSLSRAEAYAAGRDNVLVINAPHAKSRAEALNFGIQQASGDKILTIDHDDWIHPEWIARMDEQLDAQDVVSGSSLLVHEPLHIDLFNASGFQQAPPIHGGFRSFALGCNMGFKRRVFDAVGGFDPAMDKAEDIDFSWRAQESGFKLGWAPEAKLLKAIRPKKKQRFQQHVGYGNADVELQRRFGRSGYRGVRRKALKQVAWLIARAPRLLQPSKRSEWLAVAGSVLGVAQGTWREARGRGTALVRKEP